MNPNLPAQSASGDPNSSVAVTIHNGVYSYDSEEEELQLSEHPLKPSNGDEAESESDQTETQPLQQINQKKNQNTRKTLKTSSNHSKANKTKEVSLHINVPVAYVNVAKHMILFTCVMMAVGMFSGLIFREDSKSSVPYNHVGTSYAYQVATIVHGHFFTIGVFIPIGLLVLLFISYLVTGVGVSGGLFHAGFIVFEIGAVLALAGLSYRALSFLSLTRISPSANLHELEMFTWGATSSYGGKSDGDGPMSLRMLRMIFFATSHGFMLIGLLKCVVIIALSLFKKKE